MNVTLSPDVEKLVRDKVARGEYASADDLVNEAVQRLVEDEAEIAHTEALLQEAAESGEYIELTTKEWDDMEREALEEVEKRQARPR
jgi:putative addiction module CopG family antidote